MPLKTVAEWSFRLFGSAPRNNLRECDHYDGHGDLEWPLDVFTLEAVEYA
jgi:hypothetical protein